MKQANQVLRSRFYYNLSTLLIFLGLLGGFFPPNQAAQSASNPPTRASSHDPSGTSVTERAGKKKIVLPIITVPAVPPQPPRRRISVVKVITAKPAVYTKFEVQFTVQTSATTLDMPYDAAPPAGVQAGTGVTVAALFSADNWKTTLTQPAFLYRPFTHTVVDGKDHFTPAGTPVWDVRFAPPQAGAWQYRLSLKDSQGEEIYPLLAQPALSFTAAASTSKGFLQVSPTDRRYFQFSDGTPFVGVGFNTGFGASQSVEASMTRYQQNKMNFMRVWMSGAGINGSQWTSWASHSLPTDGYLPGTNYDILNTYQGGDVSLRLDDANPCLFADFWQGGVAVEPNTRYQVSARVKVSGVTGPSAGGDYGFVIKQGGWLGTDCAKSGTGKRITTPLNGSSDWVTISGSYTSGPSDKWLGNLYLTRENSSAGQVYIDEVHFYRADDTARVDLLREPFANASAHFDPINAAQWDLFIQSAETHGVYLKLVIDEKNEWIRNHLGADGKMSAVGSNDNFYAAPGTKVRWLEQAWWRYIIARWGYSSAIHSFEFINEGDPYNGRHYEAAGALAKYIHQNDPARHMVTTSFWSSFPNKEFWSNPDFAEIDYADLHAYISTGWGQTASFLPNSMLETRSEYVHSGGASARIDGPAQVSATFVPRGLVIRGPGEFVIQYWLKTTDLAATCQYGTTGSMLRIRWLLDGGTYHNGREGVVPANSAARDYFCTSPAGSIPWTQFNSTHDRDGAVLPISARIVLTDSLPHELNLVIENKFGVSGTAWIDDVELVGPDGQIQPVIGQFDTTPMDDDTTWYNLAYGQVFGAGSLVGAGKPLVRGETGVDFPGDQTSNPDLQKDTQGVWLHNNVWGQISEAGMADLFWWSSETIPQSIYGNFLSYQNFMAGIPLNNGYYRAAQAQPSDPQLRVLGQRDDTNGRIHLWIQNTQHTWKRVVSGPAISPLSGAITLSGVAAGSYRVEWWKTSGTGDPIFLTQTLVSNGELILILPGPLSDDVAVKIEKLP